VWHFASPASPIDYLEVAIQTLKVGSLGTHKALGLGEGETRKVSARLDFGNLRRSAGASADGGLLGQREHDRPRGCYDEAKRFAEAMTMAYWREHKVDTRIVRIFNTYGPENALERRAGGAGVREPGVEEQTAHGFGEGRQTRSFCYCSDSSRGFTA
jgi:dTDP-glucose 4,6-dehydratase